MKNKKKLSKNTRLLRLCSLFILIPMLLLSACNKNGNNATQTTTQDPNPPRKVTVGRLFHEIQQNASPAPQKPSKDLNDIEIGGPTPLEYLKQAPQDLVGEKLQLSFEEMLEGTTIYRYNATTKQLVIIFYKYLENTSLRTMAMLVMQTEYADMKEFLSLSDLWTGTVTAVKIVGGHDVSHSEQSVRYSNAEVKATESSTICYGYLSYNEDIVAYDSIQPDNDNYAFGFDRAVSRFGIE